MKRWLHHFKEGLYYYCGLCGTWIHISRGLHPHDMRKEQA